MEKIPVELLDFALWKSGMFACPNDYVPDVRAMTIGHNKM